ncbi:FliI/YscN family ATPase [Dyella acidisoli]|uniref:protein-secreting ATPase n=1 Tax=Dyella acidisoli TaxID=1867834 RepID=A0ABQ5XM60_9GAMM|nr:FliI/YscN family ATPase [Dyella acidisoli]GLQ92643.1 flagellar protein export ATPase FliI [Dyella acidisoli]
MIDSAVYHSRYIRAFSGADTVARLGTVTRIMPTYIEADGPGVALGSFCIAGNVMAEVVKAERGRVTLAPYAPVASLCVGDRVEAVRIGTDVSVGPHLLGRVVDPLGAPVDGGRPMPTTGDRWPLAGMDTAALDRVTPTQPLETGCRAIDSLLTLGIGQRVGIFAGSGVGKTTLLGGLARHIKADICILCLVGERGREADEFWRHALNDETRKRSVMVVATSDRPAVMRARSVPLALAYAEYFRAQGKHVLLLIDSVTRYALALREIGLAAGEPPTLRAYTPSVFAALPKIVERCGALRQGGASTAIMTVLTETDDIDDPMAETLRALLDGHIVLTRAMAEQGHFPAIDVPRSVSRVLRQVTTLNERTLATEAVGQLSLYDASRTLVESGLYVAGSNPALDLALKTRPALIQFLKQDVSLSTSRAQALTDLAELLGETA